MKAIGTGLIILCVLLCLTAGALAQDCVYISGDINYNGDASPFADVVYAINYFKGGSAIPTIPGCSCGVNPACDVNGNCSFNGIDLVFLVNYWKGGAPLNHCSTCPDPQPDTLILPREIDPGLPDTKIGRAHV
jgi:hypothetical protein